MIDEIFTQKRPSGTRKQDLHKVASVSVYEESPDPDFYVLLPIVPVDPTINHLVTALNKMFDLYFDTNFKFNILSATPVRSQTNKLSSNLGLFFNMNGVDLSDRIKPHSRILSCGASTNFLTNGDLNYFAFTDVIFSSNSFYHPDYKSMIYPVSDIGYWINLKKREANYVEHVLRDTFDFKHCLIQLKRMLSTSVINWPDATLPTLKKVDNFHEFIKENRDKEKVAIDTETSGLDFLKHEVGCITLSFDGKEGYYLPWGKINKREFSIWIHDKFQIYQNGKFDIKMLVSNGIDRSCLHIDHDTMTCENIVNEIRPRSLKSQAWIYTPWGGYDKELDSYKKKMKIKNYLDIPEPILFKYSTMDAIVTYRVYEKQLAFISWFDRRFPNPFFKENSLEWMVKERIFPSLDPVLDMEMEGAYIDIDKMREQSEYFLNLLEEVKGEVYEKFKFPPDLNIDSPLELGKEFLIKGYPKTRTTEGGVLSTADEYLHDMLSIGYKEFESLIQYRKIKTIVSKFTGEEKEKSGIWKNIVEHPDGTYRVHMSMDAYSTITLRNSCKDPNLQQIPKRDVYAKRIRSIFTTPSKDYVIAELDAKGYQLRIGACLSGDKFLIKAFSDPLIKGDVHSLTARNIFRPNMDMADFIDEIRSGNKELIELRHKGKQANLSLEFGATAMTFALDTLIPNWPIGEIDKYIKDYDLHSKLSNLIKARTSLEKEPNRIKGRVIDEVFCKYWTVALHIRDKFFKAYPDFERWIERTVLEVTKEGFIRSVHGAVRRFPELKYSGKGDAPHIIKSLKNQAVNSPVQTYENVIMTGEVTVEIHNWLKERGMKSRVWLAVHDSVVMYLHKEEMDLVIAKAKEIFERDRKEHFGVPMELEVSVADPHIGESWGFGKEL